MNISFQSRDLLELYVSESGKYATRLDKTVQDRFFELMANIAAAPNQDALYQLKGARLEKLAGNLKGFSSMRLNDKWRLLLRFKDVPPEAVVIDILDYHRG